MSARYRSDIGNIGSTSADIREFEPISDRYRQPISDDDIGPMFCRYRLTISDQYWQMISDRYRLNIGLISVTSDRYRANIGVRYRRILAKSRASGYSADI